MYSWRYWYFFLTKFVLHPVYIFYYLEKLGEFDISKLPKEVILRVKTLKGHRPVQ